MGEEMRIGKSSVFVLGLNTARVVVELAVWRT